LKKHAKQMKETAAAASAAHRSLEQRIAHADATWKGAERRDFETEHLASIRAEARHLRTELEELSRLADSAIRQLKPDR
jgi:hypothetical protein